MRLIVTRPAAQAAVWVSRLHELGVDAAALPLIAVAPPADAAPLHQAWDRLAGYALVMFVSPNAVRGFFDAARGASWPAGPMAASTGPGTTASLLAAGVAGDRIVAPPGDAASFDSEALWSRLAAQPWPGRQVLIVRGEEGRDWFAETLRRHGAGVDFVAAYRRVEPVFGPDEQALLAAACAEPARHCWHFASSQAVATLLSHAPGRSWASASALASHERIVATVRAAGFGRVDRVGVRPEEVAAHLHRSGAVPSIESRAP